MRSGPLRNRVTVETATTARNAQGQAVKTWTPLVTLWGELRTLHGDELLNAAQQKALVTHLIRLRYYPGILPTHRLRIGTRTFNVVTLDNTANRNRELLATVIEQVQPTPQ